MFLLDIFNHSKGLLYHLSNWFSTLKKKQINSPAEVLKVHRNCDVSISHQCEYKTHHQSEHLCRFRRSNSGSHVSKAIALLIELSSQLPQQSLNGFLLPYVITTNNVLVFANLILWLVPSLKLSLCSLLIEPRAHLWWTTMCYHLG